MRRFGAHEYSTWLSFVIIAGVIVLFLTVLGGLSGTTPEDHAGQMQDAIERAVIQCYALEGAYPPDLAYLESYGIYIDEEKLYVDYRPYGANLRPDIFVAPIYGDAEPHEHDNSAPDESRPDNAPNDAPDQTPPGNNASDRPLPDISTSGKPLPDDTPDDPLPENNTPGEIPNLEDLI